MGYSFTVKGNAPRLSAGGSPGFTLIELLIVVAIIGILTAIAVPQFAAYRAKAYNSRAESDLRNARTALEGYYYDNDIYPY